MNLLNRLLGILATIFIAVVVALFLVLPQVVNQLADLLGNMGRTPDQAFEWGQAAIHVAIAAVIDLPLLWFFVITPILGMFARRGGGEGLVVQKGQGIAYMDRESVRQQVYAAVTKIKDIERVEVSIDNDRGRAAILMNILTQNTISGPQKKQEIRRELRKVVEDQLGIRIAGEPTINISLKPIGGEIPQAVPGMSPETARASALPAAARPAMPPPTPVSPARQNTLEAARPLPRVEPEPAAQPKFTPQPAPQPAPQPESRPEPVKEPEALEKPVSPPPPDDGPSPIFVRRPFVPPSKSPPLDEVDVAAPPAESKPEEEEAPTESKPPAEDTLTEIKVEPNPPVDAEEKEDEAEPTEPPMTE